MPNTRNCTFSFPGKWTEDEIRNLAPNGFIALNGKEIPAEINSFYFGDNLSILNALRVNFTGKVDLIYIDPPFGTGQVFHSLIKMSHIAMK